MKTLFFILALSLGFVGFSSPSQAIAASSDVTKISSSQALEMKRGGKGKHKGWANGNRGKHKGWQKGRGNPHRFRF
jgi:hypothetical protein